MVAIRGEYSMKIRAFTLAKSADARHFVNDHCTNTTCHCEGAAHGIILANYRINFSCHCEDSERNEEDEAISLNKVDSMLRDCHATPAAPLAMTWNGKRKAAFTLAETLITLMVIGVVAALTIPALMQQIRDYTLEKQRTVFEKKFAEGLRQMRVDEKLSQKYATTADFVNEMQKYFKIATVCDKDNLTGCFSETFVYQGDADYTIKNGNSNYKSTETVNKSFTTANLKNTQAIKSATGSSLPKYASDVMGVVFSDGVQMLITVNPDCEGIASGDTTGNLYSCFGYIADVNSKKSPNNVTKDIITNIPMADLGFEIASVGAVSCLTIGFVDARTATGIEKGNSHADYWLGAKRYCENLTEDGGGWSLPTEEQLQSLADKIYKDGECTHTGNNYTNCKKESNIWNSSLFLAIGASRDNSVYLWTNVPGDSNFATYRYFYRGESTIYHNPYRYYHYGTALCVR